MEKVSGSLFKEIGHEGNRLSVKFNDGDVYHYHGVSEDQHAKMMASDSIGAYFMRHIRGKHKYTKA